MNVLVKYAGFRWVWVGQLLSQFGNAVFYVLGLWEIQLRDPFLLAIAGLAMTVPSLLSLVGGVIVDRFDPRTLMLGTDILRGTAVLMGIFALAIPGSLVWVIIVLLGIESLGLSLFYPAETVMVPHMVPGESLVEANGLYAMTSQLSSAVGYALGGAAVAAIGIRVVFGLDMASYWLSAFAILLMMRTVARPGLGANLDHESKVGMRKSLAEGLRGFRAIPALSRVLPWIVLINFAFVAGIIMLPLWIHHHLHAGAVWYGVVYAAWAGGLVVGSSISGLFSRMRLKPAFMLTFGGQAFLLLGFAASTWLALSAALLFLTGLGNGAGNALAMAWWQRIIPEAIRGRVFGLIMTLFGLASPVGSLAAGLLLHVLPLYWAWVLAGIGSLVFGASLWRIPGNLEDVTLSSSETVSG